MSELLKCPFCGGDAVIWEGPDYYKISCKEQYSCAASIGPYDSDNEAIAAWNRRVEEPNDPLTLDELREMNGEPVWLHMYSDDGCVNTTWKIIDGIEPCANGLLRNIIRFTDERKLNLLYYGETWRAYRRPPKGE